MLQCQTFQQAGLQDFVNQFTAGLSYTLCNEDPPSTVQVTQMIMSLYEEKEDHIGFHMDSADCIEEDSLILDISLGDQRELMLKNMETGK